MSKTNEQSKPKGKTSGYMEQNSDCQRERSWVKWEMSKGDEQYGDEYKKIFGCAHALGYTEVGM